MNRFLLFTAVFASLFTLAIPASAAPFVQSWSAAKGSFSVAIGDLNGDGKPDLASVGQSSVIVYTNAGNGIFSSNAAYAAGSGAGWVAIADINGDGKPDLVVACISSVVIFTNAGGGIFVSNASYAVSAGPFFVVATNVNGSGKPDIITGNSDGTLTVLTNAGGTFVTASSFQAGLPDGFANFAVGDLNGDGKPDLIIPDQNLSFGGFVVFTNSGHGIFGSNAVYNTGSSQFNGPQSIVAADFNNDGKIDIATADNDPTVTVFTNAGNGVLIKSQSFYEPNAYSAFMAVDVDGDGHPDLLSTAGGTQVILTTEFNSGSGGILVTNYLTNSGFINTVLPNNNLITAAAADINGDGKPDIVEAAQTGIYVLTNAISTFISIGTPTNVTVEATGPSGAVATFSTVTAMNWTGALPVTNNPPSGSTFPLGITTVTSSASYFITGTLFGSTNKTFTVTVHDTTPPTLTLLGANPLTNFVDAYVDPGATATDTVWGNLTGSIHISGNLVTNVPGNYTVTYSATDGSGNTGTTNRTVIIASLPPVGVGTAPGGQMALFWAIPANTNYVLQMTTNLASGNWQPVTNGTPNICITVSNSVPAAFFRLSPQ